MLKKICNSLKSRKGFTLIELMIVVAILGILSSLAVVSFTDTASGKAKAGKVKGDLRSIVSAAEMYKLDNSSYPSNGINGLVPGYLKKVPSGVDTYTYAMNTSTGEVILCTDVDSDTKVTTETPAVVNGFTCSSANL